MAEAEVQDDQLPLNADQPNEPTTNRNKKYGKLQRKLKNIQSVASTASGHGGLTPTRGGTEEAVQRHLTEELASWISHTCTIEPALHHDNLFEELRDGIIICKFITILTGIKPRTKLHSRRKCAKSDLMCHDNVIQFLDMIEDLTIPEVRFDSIQLVEGKNLKAVNNCLLYLSVEIAKRGIMSLDELPEETKRLYDKWMKKAKKKKMKKAKKNDVSIKIETPRTSGGANPHIDEVKSPKPFAGIVYNGPSDTLETLTMTLDDLSMDEATDEEETDSLAPDIKSEDNAAGESVPLTLVQDSELPDTKEASVPRKLKVKIAEEDDEDKKNTKKKKKNKNKKRKKRRTAYGFTAKDDLDRKIMKVFDDVAVAAGSPGAGDDETSEGFGGITIRKLRKPGEFQFGESKRKTYIRENNGKLFVRIGGGWEHLKVWMQKQIDRSHAVGNTKKAKRLVKASESMVDDHASTPNRGKMVGHMSTSHLHI